MFEVIDTSKLTRLSPKNQIGEKLCLIAFCRDSMSLTEQTAEFPVKAATAASTEGVMCNENPQIQILSQPTRKK